jgi:hypothetical protein
MPVAPLPCRLEPFDGDHAALVLICHSYLVSGLSDV